MFILSSCSSLDGLRFWKSDEVDPDEPKELFSIENKKDIQIMWNISNSGENEIGNFEPAFSSKSIFFADSEGTLSSIDIRSGDVDVTAVGQYHSQYQYEYSSQSVVTAKTTNGAASAGSATVSIVLASDSVTVTDYGSVNQAQNSNSDLGNISL